MRGTTPKLITMLAAILASMIAAAVAVAGPAGAIVNGWDDNYLGNDGWGTNKVQIYRDDGGEPRFYCTGGVIAARTVLTAAHCVDDLPPGERLFVLTNNVRLGTGDTMNVVGTENAPGADLAVLELDRDVNLRPEEMLRAESDTQQVHQGDRLQTWGFGLTAPGGQPAAHLQGMNSTVAMEHYPDRYGGPAFGMEPLDGARTQPGDSGGPVTVWRGDHEILYGVLAQDIGGGAAGSVNSHITGANLRWLLGHGMQLHNPPATTRTSPEPNQTEPEYVPDWYPGYNPWDYGAADSPPVAP